VHETQVVNVEPIGPNRLSVRFANGLTGDLDLAPDATYAAIRKSGRWVLE